MKWETLKDRIVEDIHANPDTERALVIKREAAERGTNVHGYLNKYDIRAAPALRERFKHLFPAYLRTCMLWTNKDAKGDWTIDNKAK